MVTYHPARKQMLKGLQETLSGVERRCEELVSEREEAEEEREKAEEELRQRSAELTNLKLMAGVAEQVEQAQLVEQQRGVEGCLLYTSPSPRDRG
eukprot:509154-Rhodomonas_salina.2